MSSRKRVDLRNEDGDVIGHVVRDVIEGAAHTMDALSFELDKAQADLSEMQSTFDLRWIATQRAIKRWQEATGRTEVWPDHADLCVWLMEEWDRLRNDGFLGEIRSMSPEDLEHVRDACQSQLDDLKDTTEDLMRG
jgi:hypothetical protein